MFIPFICDLEGENKSCFHLYIMFIALYELEGEILFSFIYNVYCFYMEGKGEYNLVPIYI